MLTLDLVTSTISLAQSIGCTSSEHLRRLSYPYCANLILALGTAWCGRRTVTAEIQTSSILVRVARIWSVRIVGLLQRSLNPPSRKASRVRIPDAPPDMTKINVPKEWAASANELLATLHGLKDQKDFETLNILWIVEKNGDLQLAYRLEPDIDELYDVIHDIIIKYKERMQATPFSKTGNIQSNTGGDCSAF